jgi:anti-sigma factor (TIGR02949 family)
MKAAITNLFFKLVGKKQGYCCKDCVKNLYAVLDGEASKDQEDYFRMHIQECSHCFNLYEIDKSVKEVIKLKVANKEVPSNLISSIKDKLSNNA